MKWRRWWAVVAWVPGVALASVDPACEGFVLPDDYDETAQQEFLQNYPALYTSFSALHAPIPHEPGRGAVGVYMGVAPPLGCGRRLVLNGTKTEDTNKSPVVPGIHVTYAAPKLGPLHFFAGAKFTPPVPLAGVQANIVSGEIGLGVEITESLQASVRYHQTSQRIVGEIAGPFDESDPVVDDLYQANTFGLDASVGYAIGPITPYVSGGFLDVSTFFFIGDDAWVGNNYHPYFGPAFSVGVDGLVADRFRFGAEFYSAPGGVSLPDASVATLDKKSRYGNLHTVRLRLALEL